MMETVHKSPGQCSSFRIGQDYRWEPKYDRELYTSIIKQDYPVFQTTRRCRVPSPKPAPIMATDARIGELTSLTRSHFVKKTFDPVNLNSNMARFSRKTNFKMETDEKTKSFETTHNEYFPVRTLDKFRNSKADWRMKMQSFIPQGDKEKVKLPLSNYKHSYNGNEMSKFSMASPLHCSLVSAPIIQGDPRTYEDQFETTSGKSFAAHVAPPQKLQPIKNNLSSIHHGDPEKCTYLVTTNQEFHKEIPLKRVSSRGPDYSSNIVFGDEKGCRPICTYRTTATDSFPLISQTERSQQININMGKSSLPEGDCDQKRSHQRITQTTNNYFFQKPVVAFPNPIVDGSKIRTKSDVDFGTEKTDKYYTTTTKSNYPAKIQAFTKNGCKQTKNSIPLDYYYGNEINQSTTFTDFAANPGGNKRLFPNPDAINKITKSHIQYPLTGQCEFITTHNLSYPPKQSKKETFELGKLQKSSIRLGNLNVY